MLLWQSPLWIEWNENRFQLVVKLATAVERHTEFASH